MYELQLHHLIFYFVISVLGFFSLSEPLKIRFRTRDVNLHIFLIDIYLFALAFAPIFLLNAILISLLALLSPLLNIKGFFRKSKKPLRSAIYRWIQFSPYILLSWIYQEFVKSFKSPALLISALFILSALTYSLANFATFLVISIDTRKINLSFLRRIFKELYLVLYQLPSAATGLLLNITFFKEAIAPFNPDIAPPLILPFISLNFTLFINYLTIKYYTLRYDEMEDLVKFLLETLQKRDEITYSHSVRVSNLAVAIAKEMGLPEDDLERIRRAALLHDIGKIDIPDSILFKPGKLTNMEFNLITFHPLIAFGLVQSMELSDYVGGDYILYHHEKYVGGGYPYNLSFEAIPLGARIISVADVFDALASKRPYKNPMSLEKVVNLIFSLSGIHFDPKVVAALYRLYSRGDLNHYPELPENFSKS